MSSGLRTYGRPSRRQLMSSGGAEFRLGRQGRAHAGGNKLRTYARFKTGIGQEAYLSTNMRSSTRKLFCRFRIGVAPLQIEIGRREPVPGSRACPVCGAEEEDEEHFLMHGLPPLR